MKSLKKRDIYQKSVEANLNEILEKTMSSTIFVNKKNFPEQTTTASELGFFNKQKIFCTSLTVEYISKIGCKLKLQLDTGANSTMISSENKIQLVKLQLEEKIRYLEAYDGRQLKFL